MTDPIEQLHPADSLKTLEQITVADPRNKHIELADWHNRVAKLELTPATPTPVKQLFENAKNIALYTYFAYRLHQAAEATGYSALEKALKMRYHMERQNLTGTREPRTLQQYMNLALSQGWISDEGYESSRHLAASRVSTQKICQMIEDGALESGEPVPVPEPEEQEIIAEMRSMDLANTRLHAGRRVRNFLAHGDHGLSDTSIATLAKIAEEINQLFPSV